VLSEAKAAGVPQSTFDMLTHAGIDLKQWLTGFSSVTEGVTSSVKLIREHPLLPKNLPVHGLVIHPETGKLDLLTDGAEAR